LFFEHTDAKAHWNQFYAQPTMKFKEHSEKMFSVPALGARCCSPGKMG